MQNSARIALASWLVLAQACGPASRSERPEASAGAPSATAGSVGVTAGASPAEAGASPLSEAGGAGRASLAGGGAAGSADLNDVQTVLDTYRSFAPQTPAPVSVSGYIFGLCRLPTLRKTEFAASIHGDERYLRDWANPLAGQGIATHGAPAFPVGAVIVKEKYAGAPAAPADLVAIALMIKRASGFDPAHGDWEYAYYEAALGIVRSAEQTAYCASCHAGAAATDYVYVDGLKP